MVEFFGIRIGYCFSCIMYFGLFCFVFQFLVDILIVLILTLTSCDKTIFNISTELNNDFSGTRTIDIAVDRKNARHSALAYQRACNQLIKEKRSMVIFPEGTIPGNTPKLGRFKDGAFKLAIETQTDILPVTIIKNWEILPDNGKFRFRPGKVYQYVHEPISTKVLTTNDITSLKEKVQHLIANKLNEYGYNQ